jgi:cytochrome c oxidase subunit II
MPAWISWLFPEQASTLSSKVDLLYLFMILVTGAVATLVFFLITVFAIRYRRTAENQKGANIEGSIFLETFWTGTPLLIFIGMFVWGAVLYYERSAPPAGSMEIYVVAKQWMWKLQHSEGPREINELHVPVGVPVRLVMTSQDVIHSFFVPAFRIKQDVLPGRYTTQWFQATKPGQYHLFCAEYCGNQHSRMAGYIQVMSPADYQAWIDSQRLSQPMPASGQTVFNQLGCSSCHSGESTGRGPSLYNLYGRSVPLQSGGTALAEESYLRESILNPAAKLVQGYKPVMPTYQGQIGDDQLNELIDYIKSLKR